MVTTTKRLTATDLWNLANDDPHDFELIEGELIPIVPIGGEHGSIQVEISGLLRSYVAERSMGRLFSETGFVLDSGQHTVLAPDLAFVAASRLPVDLRGYLHLAPDLAVEIVSPGNSPGDIERKVALYLAAGVRLIWVIYPDQRQIVAHAPNRAPRVFQAPESIPGDDILPGLTIGVEEIFA
ncbi:MAG: Uma2 family endonuclease [Thermomicrobiales bacterium]